METKEEMVTRRVVQIMNSIEYTADIKFRQNQTKKTKSPGFHWGKHLTLERVVRDHIRVAVVAGMETTMADWVVEMS